MVRTVSMGFMMVLLAGGFGSPVIAQEQHVKNGSFEVDSDGDGIPDEWRPHGLGPDDERVPGGTEGNFSFRIVGERGVNKALRQTIRKRFPAGTHIIFEANSKAERDFRSGGLYAMKAEFIFRDGTTLVNKAGFKSDTGGWENESRFVILPKDVKRIDLSVIFNDHEGTAWFDQVRLWTP